MKREMFDWINNDNIEAKWCGWDWMTAKEYAENRNGIILLANIILNEDHLRDFQTRPKPTKLDKALDMIESKYVYDHLREAYFVPFEEVKTVLKTFIKD